MSSIYILPGDIFGFLALIFISATALFMLARKRILRYSRNLDLLRRIHVFVAVLGGLFLILHVAYYITYPITSPIILGYVSTGVAAVVWLTGMAFLERFKDTLFYHGSLSFAAISLIIIHAMSAGINLPDRGRICRTCSNIKRCNSEGIAARGQCTQAKIGETPMNRREFIRSIVISSTLVATGVVGIAQMALLIQKNQASQPAPSVQSQSSQIRSTTSTQPQTTQGQTTPQTTQQQTSSTASTTSQQSAATTASSSSSQTPAGYVLITQLSSLAGQTSAYFTHPNFGRLDICECELAMESFQCRLHA